MSLLIIKEKELWNEKLKDFDFVDVFFDYDYLNAFNNEEGDTSIEAVYFEDDKGKLFYPYIKRSLNLEWIPENFKNSYDITSGFGASGYLTKGDTSSFEQLWENHVKHEKIISEFIRVHPLFPIKNTSTSLPIHISDFVFLDFNTDIDSIFRSFRKGHKSDIKYAEKKHLVEEVTISEFLIAFKKFTLRLDLKRQYKAAKSLLLFEKTNPNQLLCLGVKDSNGEILACSTFVWKEKGCSNYLFAAINSKERGLASLIIWEAIKISFNRNVRYFSFGGGATINDGIFKFKKGFSDHILPYSIYKIVHESKTYDLSTTNYNKIHSTSNLFPSYRKFT